MRIDAASIALIRLWIDQGARATPSAAPAPAPWEAPLALDRLRSLLAGQASLTGAPIRQPTRWAIIRRLIAIGAPDASALFAAERTRDTSTEAAKDAFEKWNGFHEDAIHSKDLKPRATVSVTQCGTLILSPANNLAEENPQV